MALGDTEIIDSIDVHKETGDLVLSIFHECTWEDAEHLIFLQSKINTCLAFVCDGQLAAEYPEHVERDVQIQIASKYAPTEEGRKFAEQATKVLLEYDVSLKIVSAATLREWPNR